MLTAHRLNGVNLGTLGGSIAPHGLVVLRQFGNAILVSNENVTVGHQHGIANLAPSLPVLVGPSHLSFVDDEHTHTLALSSIEKVVAVQVAHHVLCCHRH